MPLNDRQQIAHKMAITSKVSIITGAPGVGKTYTLASIHEWAKDNRVKIAQAAPTGKAAKQMTMATGIAASTIHKLLEPRKSTNGFEFTRNQENPINADMVVLDECSMITNNLMADVIRAIDFDRTSLLLIGDHYQLPSVGAGAVLRDLIGSGVVPVTELTEIQRNSGDIVRACHLIKDSKIYEPSEWLDTKNGQNLRHLEVSSPEMIHHYIREIVTERMPSRGHDPVWDVQVLSPTNKRTILSCDGLNTMLQKKLNSGNPAIDKYNFRVGDKIIQTKNEQIPNLVGEKELVVNGDIGLITEIDKSAKLLTVTFFDPDRAVRIPMYDHNLLMAYCITVHRFQGSEAPVVIIPVHSSFNFFVNRNWLYTAISRAKEICITIGQFSAIRQAIKTDMAIKRVTRLKEKLNGNTVPA